MVHRYKNNGYNIVLDVNSGAVHVVDDIVYDVIPYLEQDGETPASIRDSLAGKYPEEEIKAAGY